MDLEACVDVLPWILFVVVDRRSGLGLGWAAASSMASGAVLGAWSRWRGRGTPVPWVAVGTFGTLCGVALVLDVNGAWFEPTLRSGAVLVLGVAAALSLRWTPLSEHYTQEQVSSRRQADPEFRRVNRRITALWSATALLVAVCFSAVAAASSAIGLTVFDWVLPIMVLGVGLRAASLQWSRFLVGAEVEDTPSLAEASLGAAGDGGHAEPCQPPAEGAVITYLPGVQPSR